MLKTFANIFFVLLLPMCCIFADWKYEAEDLLINKEVLLENRYTADKWNLMSNDTDAMKKWSKGVVIQSPPILKNSKAGETLPILKFSIPLPENGNYDIIGLAHRVIGVSIDGGKTWRKSRDGKLASNIDASKGALNLWIAGCFANDGNLGSCYVDYFIVKKAARVGKVVIEKNNDFTDLLAKIRRNEVTRYSLEAEMVLQNPHVLVYDVYKPNRWALLTNDTDAIKKWSGGVVIQSPPILKNSTPGDGLPILKFAIPLPPTGEYNIKGLAHRAIGISIDGGKTWKKSCDGILAQNVPGSNKPLQLWITGCFVNDNNPGSCYIDSFSITPARAKKSLNLTDLQSFTLPDGSTQISCLTSIPVKNGKLIVKKENGETFEIQEKFDNLRNHVFVIPLNKVCIGENISCQVVYPDIQSEELTLTAGKKAKIECSQDFKIELKINEKTSFGRKKYLVRSGVPFAKGVLAKIEDCRLVDNNGKQIPADFEVFSYHNDGSIKWLVISCNADTAPNRVTKVYLTKSETSEKIQASTEISADVYTFINSLQGVITLPNNQKLIADCRNGKIIVKKHTSVFDFIEINGKFGNSTFEYNLEIYRRQDRVFDVKWRIINRNKQPITLIKSFYWQNLPYIGQSNSIIQLHEKQATSNGQALEHVDGFIEGEKGGVFVKNFSQLYPKSLSSDNANGIAIGILPELPQNYLPSDVDALTFLRDYFWFEKGMYKFKNNMNLRGEFFYTFGDAQNFSSEILANPLFLAATPEYYCSSGAFGNVNAVKKGCFDKYEAALDRNFNRFVAKRAQNHEYGWMSFGDWFGERKYNWGNNEYDVTALCVTQFARSGNYEYLKRGDEMTHHYTSIDFVDYASETAQKELIFCHSIGHTGSFINKRDPRFSKLGIIPLFFDGCLDFYGGHDHQQGTFLTSCLMGDKYYFEVAEKAARAQALFMTPEFFILIERAAGWALANAVYAYEFTNNPLFLNAAKIYFEEVQAQQNPISGGLDLEQDAAECTCPDRQNHIGGKPFAVGVLMHSIGKYYEISGNEDAKKSLILMADWLLNEAYDENSGNFRYKTGCPQYMQGTWFPKIITEGIAIAGYLSNDPKYIDFLIANAGRVLHKNYSSSGKEFAQEFRALPYLFYFLEKQGVTDIKNNGPVLPKNLPTINLPDGEIIEAEIFADEDEGAVQLHTKKINASMACIYFWDNTGHALTYQFNAPTRGKYQIYLRCASVESAQRKFVLNNQDMGIFVLSPNKGMCNTSDDWMLLPLEKDEQILEFEFQAGVNTLKFINIDGKSLNLDFINLKKIK